MTAETLVLYGLACFITGAMVGVFVGMFIFALCAAASDGR